jgi:hypothetical protein
MDESQMQRFLQTQKGSGRHRDSYLPEFIKKINKQDSLGP